jgi:chemosensory pili system protein ChpE
MTELFVSAFLLGLLFNAMPGAVFAESLRRGMRGGFGPALGVQVGSLLGDFVWAVLGLMGAAVLFSLPIVQTPMAILGGLFLLWLAWQALRDGLGPVPRLELDTAQGVGRGDLAVGAILSLSNPMNITYWAGLGGTVVALGAADANAHAFVTFLAGFMTSSFLWCFLCAGLIAWTRRQIGPRLWQVLHIGSAVGLAYFAWRILSRVMDPRP